LASTTTSAALARCTEADDAPARLSLAGVTAIVGWGKRTGAGVAASAKATAARTITGRSP
jgi:hypothetical protein